MRRFLQRVDEAEQLTETNYGSGQLSGGGSVFEHIYFNDHTWFSVKRIPSTLRFVYLDHRGQGGIGIIFSEPMNSEGYKASEVKKWIKDNYPTLLPHWTLYRANHPT
ncbi:hypothetical protein NIES4072_25030 [Nostoc commune NIES-4072]|uniref:Uncharacterized protein n=1 Tax=Nostoc commune NIES-4072 TaxID=2005467 RepID=A0A2R5FN06_NOSCO|nr:hypothetical protein [Nostoc commune]BBD63841.1 hypothetical protein NIES4070_01830 [Nostoc commune HK-02]GBG18838.1 hypothetical protein NIES4072_25030 [Nostoc commune NIES-4072]